MTFREFLSFSSHTVLPSGRAGVRRRQRFLVRFFREKSREPEKSIRLLWAFGYCTLPGLAALILAQYGTVPLLQSYSCFVAFVLMGAACISIGMFVSSLTEHQILAAVGTFAVLLVSYLINGMRGLIGAAALNSLAGFALMVLAAGALLAAFTKSVRPTAAVTVLAEAALAVAYVVAPTRFEGLFPHFLESFSLFERYYDFVDGAFDVTHLVYYLSVTGLFLFWTVQSVEKRRWS